MQSRDAIESALLKTAHRLDLPGGAGTAASYPRFDDTEVPIAVVGINPPGIEPRCGGRQQDLTGEPIDRVVDASPRQLRRQTVARRTVQVPLGHCERHLLHRAGSPAQSSATARIRP